MPRVLLIVFLLTVMFSSCKKNNTEVIRVSGNVIDKYSNQPLAGVGISVFQKCSGSSFFGPVPHTAGKGTSDEDGKFLFEFEVKNGEQDCNDYGISIGNWKSSQNYYSFQADIKKADEIICDLRIYQTTRIFYVFVKQAGSPTVISSGVDVLSPPENLHTTIGAYDTMGVSIGIANAYNRITYSITDTLTHLVTVKIDSVFCRVDQSSYIYIYY